ncbi:hypothetical protein L218DRAFT_856547 [Marasmius fiardii PR-910]|nr:hypothetical protein L218DRAFT_856547 [Marasmius fiardii PR-910]
MGSYNLTRYGEELLERTKKDPPSFTIHLHSDHFNLNASKKWSYTHPIACIFEDIRAHRIPVDFLELFNNGQVPFYDGCMIVELLDYRSQNKNEPVLERPEQKRMILHPNGETLWADICLLSAKPGRKWTDREVLEIEAGILLATAPPLCLDPDPHLTRIANNVLRVSTPTEPALLKRKADVVEPEERETEKAKRAKIMQFGNPRLNRPYAPSYAFLFFLIVFSSDSPQQLSDLGCARPKDQGYYGYCAPSCGETSAPETAIACSIPNARAPASYTTVNSIHSLVCTSLSYSCKCFNSLQSTSFTRTSSYTRYSRFSTSTTFTNRRSCQTPPY